MGASAQGCGCGLIHPCQDVASEPARFAAAGFLMHATAHYMALSQSRDVNPALSMLAA